MNSWTPVKIINPDHPHTGTGGTVTSAAPRPGDDGAQLVDVRLDVTGAEEVLDVNDLQALG